MEKAKTPLYGIYVTVSYTCQELDAQGMTEYAMLAGGYYAVPLDIAQDMYRAGKCRPSTDEERHGITHIEPQEFIPHEAGSIAGILGDIKRRSDSILDEKKPLNGERS